MCQQDVILTERFIVANTMSLVATFQLVSRQRLQPLARAGFRILIARLCNETGMKLVEQLEDGEDVAHPQFVTRREWDRAADRAAVDLRAICAAQILGVPDAV
jgi:hypothetical protein